MQLQQEFGVRKIEVAQAITAPMATTRHADRAMSQARIDAQKEAGREAQAARKARVVRLVKTSKTGSKDAPFASQRLPQLSTLRIGVDQAWVLEAIEAVRTELREDTGITVELAQVVRMAIAEALSDGELLVEASPRSGYAGTIGPIRLTEEFAALPMAIERAALRGRASKADVMRSALAQWLIGKGYGEGKSSKRKKG